jgi:hypothetical protein
VLIASKSQVYQMGTVLLQVDPRLAALQTNEIVSRCESCCDR